MGTLHSLGSRLLSNVPQVLVFSESTNAHRAIRITEDELQGGTVKTHHLPRPPNGREVAELRR